jgi:hypothetical protein
MESTGGKWSSYLKEGPKARSKDGTMASCKVLLKPVLENKGFDGESFNDLLCKFISHQPLSYEVFLLACSRTSFF